MFALGQFDQRTSSHQLALVVVVAKDFTIMPGHLRK
jgi:hypothetical protein